MSNPSAQVPHQPETWTSSVISIAHNGGYVSIGTTINCEEGSEAYDVDDVLVGTFRDEDGASDALCDRWEAKNGGGPTNLEADENTGATSDINTRTVAVTFFPDKRAQSQRRIDLTLPQLADQIRRKTGPSKEKLPWLKLMVFGEKRSDRNCLRTNANAEGLTGIEVEYDKGEIAFDTAIAAMRTAKLSALAYTSPSYVPTTKERWRILLPLSTNCEPEEREKFVARVNGLFKGKLAPESFNLSLAYLYGSVNGNPAHRAEVIDGDFIDLRTDLDQDAIGKSASPRPKPGAGKHITSADIADAFKHRDPGKGLGEGITFDQPVIDFELVKAECAWLRTVHETHGAGELEPLWKMVANVCVFLPNGDKLIHELSNGDARYTREETEGQSIAGPTSQQLRLAAM